jgi:hypothetical protein
VTIISKEEYLLKKLYHSFIDKTFHPHFKQEDGIVFRAMDSVMHSFIYKDKNKALQNTIKYTIKGLRKKK